MLLLVLFLQTQDFLLVLYHCVVDLHCGQVLHIVKAAPGCSTFSETFVTLTSRYGKSELSILWLFVAAEKLLQCVKRLRKE